MFDKFTLWTKNPVSLKRRDLTRFVTRYFRYHNIYMPRRCLLIVIFCTVAFASFLRTTEAQNPPPSISGKFYKFDVVGSLKSDFAFFGGPSINDSGTVAVVGFDKSGIDRIFRRDVNV